MCNQNNAENFQVMYLCTSRGISSGEKVPKMLRSCVVK